MARVQFPIIRSSLYVPRKNGHFYYNFCSTLVVYSERGKLQVIRRSLAKASANDRVSEVIFTPQLYLSWTDNLMSISSNERCLRTIVILLIKIDPLDSELQKVRRYGTKELH